MNLFQINTNFVVDWFEIPKNEHKTLNFYTLMYFNYMIMKLGERVILEDAWF